MQTRVSIPIAAVLLTACAGNGEGLDENGRPSDEADEPLIAEFASIQRHVFTPMCTGCHGGAAAPLGLRLDDGAAFAMLVGTPSVEVPALNRVQPGNPDASYLVRKIEGTAAVGARMPLNAPPLPPETIAVIRQWIANGAMPSALAPDRLTNVAPKVESIWPVANARVAGSPKELLLSAATELDTTVLNAGTVELHRIAPDASSAVVMTSSVLVRSLSPTVFAVRSEESLQPGAYELRVSGTAPLALTDLNGTAIDGDDDGVAGGDLIVQFEVERAQ